MTNAGDGDVSVLNGRNDGTFRPKVDHPLEAGAVWVAASRLNSDRKLDMAIANDNEGEVHVLLNE